jgi:hypothetical protein
MLPPPTEAAEMPGGGLARTTMRTTMQGKIARLRLPIPERILRMATFGLRHAPGEDEDGRDPSGWWRRVEREMESAVFAHVPGAARSIEMHLDAEALEVVVEYALPA